MCFLCQKYDWFSTHIQAFKCIFNLTFVYVQIGCMKGFVPHVYRMYYLTAETEPPVYLKNPFGFVAIAIPL